MQARTSFMLLIACLALMATGVDASCCSDLCGSQTESACTSFDTTGSCSESCWCTWSLDGKCVDSLAALNDAATAAVGLGIGLIIVLIVVPVVITIILIVLCVYCCCMKKKETVIIQQGAPTQVNNA
jgi:hypothetical protein